MKSAEDWAGDLAIFRVLLGGLGCVTSAGQAACPGTPAAPVPHHVAVAMTLRACAGVTTEDTLKSPDNKIQPDYYMVGVGSRRAAGAAAYDACMLHVACFEALAAVDACAWAAPDVAVAQGH